MICTEKIQAYTEYTYQKIQANCEVNPKRYKLMKNNAEKIQANREVVLKRYRLPENFG